MLKTLLAASALVLATGAMAQQISGGSIPNPLPTTDPTVAANTAAIAAAQSSNFGGYDLGPVTVSATMSASSLGSGVALGLYTIAVARTLTLPSGILMGLSVRSQGGNTVAYSAYVWDKIPANTTCTDGTAFADSVVDDAYLLYSPISVTPAAPLSGGTPTYADFPISPRSFKVADSPATQNIYVCLVSTGSNTADVSKAVQLTAYAADD